MTGNAPEDTNKTTDTTGSDPFDFSQEKPSSKGSGSYHIGKPYDPREQEDTARRNIAYVLIGLLCFLVVAILLLVAVKSIKLQEIKEFAVILGPIVTLVSAATGFYYGTKSNRR